jgi:hypothetical protein
MDSIITDQATPRPASRADLERRVVEARAATTRASADGSRPAKIAAYLDQYDALKAVLDEQRRGWPE